MRTAFIVNGSAGGGLMPWRTPAPTIVHLSDLHFGRVDPALQPPLQDRMHGLLAGFKRHISADLAPLYRDAQIAVLGLNSARSLAVKNGRVNRRPECQEGKTVGILGGYALAGRQT
jgi:hypothetical protein